MKSILLRVVLLLLISLHLHAQKAGFNMSGDFGIYGDFYHMSSDTDGAVKARRPGAVGRFMMNTTFSYGKFSLPFSVMLTQGQQSVIYPTIPNRDWLAYVKDPANRVGIAPKYKWVELLLGTQVPQYSELSIGDLPVFGAGINLTPGWFRFSFFTGTTQWAIAEDTSSNIQGFYARKMFSTKVGFGKETSSHLYFIGTLMEDDTSSLKVKPINTTPQKGMLTSIDYRLNLSKKIYMKGEVAASVFTRDTRSAIVDSLIPELKIPFDLFHIQQTSRFDYATVLSITKTGKVFGISLAGKYIGDGFVPMGYPMMQTDRMDFLISPTLNILKDKVQLTGSFGTRLNNLSGAKGATTYQTLANADINIQFTEQFSVSANYSNFDYRNKVSNDTLRIQLVTSSWTLSPTYTLSGLSNIHVFTGVYSQNVFTDFNTISGAANANNSFNALLSYVLSKVETPFSFNASLSYFENHLVIGTLSTKSLGTGVGYRFFKKKLNTNLGITYNQNTDQTNSSSSQVMGTGGMKYNLTKKMAFSLNASINLFKYGQERPGISYTESMLRSSITYKF